MTTVSLPFLEVGGQNIVRAIEVSFTETTGAGTYTANVAIPAGATLLDVQWSNGALWTASTSATLNVGDDDDTDSYFVNVNLKSAPAADINNGAGGISNFLSSSGTGDSAGFVKTAGSSGFTLTATVVTVGTTGNAGRSRLRALYMLPDTSFAATKA